MRHLLSPSSRDRGGTSRLSPDDVRAENDADQHEASGGGVLGCVIAKVACGVSRTTIRALHQED
jgi:hypothetical protein